MDPRALEWGLRGGPGWHALPGPLSASPCLSGQTERSYGAQLAPLPTPVCRSLGFVLQIGKGDAEVWG